MWERGKASAMTTSGSTPQGGGVLHPSLPPLGHEEHRVQAARRFCGGRDPALSSRQLVSALPRQQPSLPDHIAVSSLTPASLQQPSSLPAPPRPHTPDRSSRTTRH